jgi:hypothetical protein
VLLYLSLTLALAALNFSYSWTFVEQAHPGWSRVIDLLPELSNACILSCFFLLPDGRFVPRWSAMIAVGWLGVCLARYASPGAWLVADGPVGWLGWWFDLSWYVAGIGAQVYRYRNVSTPAQRQQTKWVVFGLTIGVVGYFGWQLAFSLFPTLNDPGKARLVFWLTARPLYVLSLTLVPVTLLIAALRFRLWDIDLIINRTLVYTTLTVLLGAGYEVGVVLLQRVLDPLTHGSNLAVAGSTLIVAALARPARHWIQAAVDRRFNRRRYDAARTIQTFSARLRDELDLTQLSADLCAVAQETMQPGYVSLWLRE